VAAQRALSAHTWPDGVEPRVRIGVHTGEPVVTSEGYVGIDVHRAARIGDAANGGQVLVSESTRSLIGEQIVLRDLGEYRLAGLDRPERLYQVVAAGLASEFEPPRAQPQARRRKDRLRTADPTKVGWRVHGLGSVAPSTLSRPLESLAGAALEAARVIASADHTLATTNRDELAARFADHQARGTVAPHVAQAAVELERQLVALDRLPERRRAVAENVWRLDDELESLELRLRNAPRAGQAPALREELEHLRNRLTETVRLLEKTNAAAPSAPPIPTGGLRRTRRRGIYRVGRTYVVLHADEDGVKRPKVAASLAEAIQLRDTLRVVRRRGANGRNLGATRPQWEDKSSGGGGA
jgi:hypothetical protein